MQLPIKDRLGLVDAAMGRKDCDVVLRNAQIVNVITGEVYKGNVGIYDGFIAHVQCDPDNLNRVETPLKGAVEYDLTGKYLIPGFIDAHIHIESTMMTPRHFVEAALPHGTTTIITDPHEIANVCGLEGVKYMIENSSDVPMRQYVLAPSCVPAVLGKENAGAEFFAKEIEEMLSYDRLIGLAEVMDFIGVINNDSRMVDIINVMKQRDMFIQGHAPFMSGRELSAYLCGGPTSDHENRLGQEARDKMRNGMYVDGRESSISKNLHEIIPGAKDLKYKDHLTLCTDDKEADDVLYEGHMNEVVRQAQKYGLDPIDAIRSATYNVAREVGIKNLGAIAPAFVADLAVVDSLESLKVEKVFFEGKLVAQDGQLVEKLPIKTFTLEDRNTVYVDRVDEEMFKFKAPIQDGLQETLVMTYNTAAGSATEVVYEKLPVKDGYLDISHDNGLKYALVINRHPGKNTIGYGVVRNFGTHHGAVASTVSHDSHNLTVVFDTPENAMIVVKDLIANGGGMSCAENGQLKEHLILSIAGLISKLPAKELAEESAKMKKALQELGLVEIVNPLLRIATLALPVIPNVKMSDLGIIDVLTQQLLPLYKD